MPPHTFRKRDDKGRFLPTHDEGTPCCGAEWQSSLMPSGSYKQSCPECGRWELVG